MGDGGFSSRQSLTVIELHFVGMYGPGFFSGKLIKRKGTRLAVYISIFFFAIGTLCNLLSEEEDSGSIATWYLGLTFLGIGWNFGFTAATVWTAEIYKTSPHLKLQVQASSDFLMFLIAGAFVFSSGYIFDAGGVGLDGWKTLNLRCSVCWDSTLSSCGWMRTIDCSWSPNRR